MDTRRLAHPLVMPLCAAGLGVLAACGGAVPVGAVNAVNSVAKGATAAAAAPPSPIAAVAARPGLTWVASRDVAYDFTAPGGQAVEALLQGPKHVSPGMPCPGAQCYVMRPIGPGETPDAYFPAAVQAALAAHAHKLVIPQGTYNFQGPAVDRDSTNPNDCNEANYWNCSPHWTIGAYPATPMSTPDAITDLEIDLSGAVLNFAAPTTGIWILNVERLRLSNFTIDWPALRIASLGTIVADPQNPGHHALVLDAAYPAIDPLTGTAVQIQAVDPWDDSTATPTEPGRFDLSANNANETYFIFGPAPQPVYVGKTSAGAQTFSCAPCSFVNGPGDPTCSMFNGCANFDGFALGARVIVRHYTYNGFAILMNWSNDVDIENAIIRTGPGMGIAVQNAGGFRGFRVANSTISRAPGRLISTASDGINVSQFGGDVMLMQNEIAYQGDDAINISPGTEAIVGVAAGSIAVSGGCEPDVRDLAVAGDTLAFVDGNGNWLGNAAVGAVRGSPCTTPQQTLTLPCPGSNACAALVAALTPADSFVDLVQQPAARYVVKGNTLHDNRGHGTFLGAPLGAVSGNTYSWNTMGPAYLGELATGNVLSSGNVTE
jgi:hypothetical protein